MKRYLLCFVLAGPLCAGCATQDPDSSPSNAVDQGRGATSCGPACEAACAAPGVDDPLVTTADLEAKVVGRWVHCSGWKIAVGNYYDVEGIEILADHRFFTLVAGPGGLVRGQGFDYEGTWVTSSYGNPYQINFFFNGERGQFPTAAAFRKQPRLVRFLHTAGVVDYALMP